MPGMCGRALFHGGRQQLCLHSLLTVLVRKAAGTSTAVCALGRCPAHARTAATLLHEVMPVHGAVASPTAAATQWRLHAGHQVDLRCALQPAAAPIAALTPARPHAAAIACAAVQWTPARSCVGSKSAAARKHARAGVHATTGVWGVHTTECKSIRHCKEWCRWCTHVVIQCYFSTGCRA